MKSQGMTSIIEIFEENGLIDLNEIKEIHITVKSLSIFNANGIFIKVQKIKLLEKLNFQPIEVDSYIALLIWK